MLFVAFASVRDAALVLVNVPFSFVGGILALYLRGIHLSVSAAVGFVTLFGVAVMGGLLYVAEINRRLGEPGASLQDAVVSGAKSQVRPMFMLIVVAMLGMIPAAIATGIGSDIQRPLATVIVGGLGVDAAVDAARAPESLLRHGWRMAANLAANRRVLGDWPRG